MISHNQHDGIRVERGSQLEFADNDIEDNGGNGVAVMGNSGAIVEIGAGTSRKPNRTRPDAANAEFGVACSVGGTSPARSAP